MSRKRRTLCRISGGGKGATLEGDAGRIVDEVAEDLENVLDTIEFRQLARRRDALVIQLMRLRHVLNQHRVRSPRASARDGAL